MNKSSINEPSSPSVVQHRYANNRNMEGIDDNIPSLSTLLRGGRQQQRRQRLRSNETISSSSSSQQSVVEILDMALQIDNDFNYDLFQNNAPSLRSRNNHQQRGQNQ